MTLAKKEKEKKKEKRRRKEQVFKRADKDTE